MYDAIAALRAGGQPVDQLTPVQLEVMRSLTPTEVDMLNSITARLEAAGDDVQGHVVGVGIF
jgi:hypothetical protein